MGGRAGQQPCDGQRRHGFFRTAFAHQTDRFPHANGQRHRINGADRLLARAEIDQQIFDLQQHRQCKIPPSPLTSVISR